MSPRKRRVAILGGGMAAMAAAWRLSEPGWQDELESITVYQRGWRLGGKGASSRAQHGRIEEHGLHLWLGYYENAFRLLRECYEELDRPTTDPTARVLTWRDAMLPVTEVGLEHLDDDGWSHWVGQFTRNDLLPGEPDAGGGDVDPVDLVRRALRLVVDFLDSLMPEGRASGRLELSASPVPSPPPSNAVALLPLVAVAGILETITRLEHGVERRELGTTVEGLDRALATARQALASIAEHDNDLRRTWHLVSVMTACVRGVLADSLLFDERGFRAANDEDFLDWIIRHGASPEVAEFAFIRGLYDLVFADGGEDRSTRGVSAGVAVFMTSKMFFEYRGAIFWKMAAGMGDVVFAPLYQALRRRGVDFELFHRVDRLHVSGDGLAIDGVTVGRQARLADGVERYEPLVRVRDLPCFPAAPLVEQLADVDIEGQPLESHWCEWPDAEQRVLRRGVDFDDLVFAIPPGMASFVCDELVAHRRAWRAMLTNLSTTATQALQLWLNASEPSLGWRHPGMTVSAYAQPFNTWASMDQLIGAEDWPAHDRPGTIAYFCGALDAPWPLDPHDRSYPERARAGVRAGAQRFITEELGHLLPGAVDHDGFRWELLCGAGDAEGPGRLDSQLCLANVDPSDRYVQCVPGSDQHRLRSDESGFDNLFLAGDWTDNGLNAGCIEAAVLSGLQAANAVLGRRRDHRIAGAYLL